jgi:YHYH protein
MSLLSPRLVHHSADLLQLLVSLRATKMDVSFARLSKTVVLGSLCLSAAICNAEVRAATNTEAAEPILEQDLAATLQKTGSPPCRTQEVFPLYRAKFLPHVVVYPYQEYIVVEAAAKPIHRSPYFPIGSPGYEPYNGYNPRFFRAPNDINQNTRYRYVFPACPRYSSQAIPTPLGPIGVTLEGVPFYNQYAGGGAALGADELDSFDQYNGHPDQMGTYHHHKEPYFLTVNPSIGRGGLVGFLLDGVPVYGPYERDHFVQNGELDALHGHTHPTAEYPHFPGVYHYHITDSAPYINGNGFRSYPGYATLNP